jgi:uncharacterized delta-60 repeat protein
MTQNKYQQFTTTLLVSAIICIGSLSNVFAQCGYLDYAPDYSFDFDGIATTDIGNQTLDYGTDIAVLADGKTIVAGRSYSTGWDFAIAKYNANGSIDTTFGTSGKSVADFSNRIDLAGGMAMQSNGKIVVVGETSGLNNTASGDFALARFNANGSRDITFGSLGKVTTDFAGLGDSAKKVAIQIDGKIVVVGKSLISAGNIGYAIARYNSNGTLDTTFSGDGKAVYSMGDYGANDVLIQPDGKILVVGSGTFNFGVLRILSNGLPDASFGIFGKVAVDFGGNDVAYSVGLQSDGKIIIGGSAQSAFGELNNSALVRLNSNGTLDTAFDGDGKITINLNTADNDYIADLVIKSNGEILAIGNAGYPNNGAIVSYNPTVQNPCFYLYPTNLLQNSGLSAVALRGSKTYLAGTADNQTTYADFMVAVFETNTPQ